MVVVEPESGDLFGIMCPDSIRIIQRDDYATFHQIQNFGATAITWSEDGLLFAAGDEKVRPPTQVDYLNK